jgi:hypothetical protein
MRLTIKSPKMIFPIEIDENATVLCLKQAIKQAHPDISAGSLRLIYAGKFLVDDRPLQFYSMQSGHAVHMVVSRSDPPASRGPPAAAVRLPTVRESLAGINLGRLGEHPLVFLFGPYFFQNPTAFAQIIDSIPLLAHDPEIQEFRRDETARAAALRELEVLAGGEIQWGSPFGIPDVGDVDVVAYMNSLLGQQMTRHITEHPEMWRETYLNSPGVDRNPMVRQLFSHTPFTQEGMLAAEAMFADPEHARAIFRFAQELFVPQQVATNMEQDPGPQVLDQNGFHHIWFANMGPVEVTNEEEEEEEEEEDVSHGEQPEPVQPRPSDVTGPAPVLDVNAPPDERFAVQLRLMADMGFMDQQRNTRALIATNGDLESAVEWLLTLQ